MKNNQGCQSLRVCIPREKENASEGSQSAQVFGQFLSGAVLETEEPWGQRRVGGRELSGALRTLTGHRAKVTFRAGEAAGIRSQRQCGEGSSTFDGVLPCKGLLSRVSRSFMDVGRLKLELKTQ